MSKNNTRAPAALKIGVGRKTINPPKGHSLAGYFNERPNKGVHDDLCVKVLLIEQGGAKAGMIAYDLILLSDPLIARIRKALAAAGFAWGATIPLAATHTHTGPDVGGIFDLTDRFVEYQESVAKATVEAAREAQAAMAPANALCGTAHENPCAFNRRFWMKHGRVVTNPGVGNRDIVRTESEIDDTLHVLGFRGAEGWRAIVVNVSNHTDTFGVDVVSTDWPGRMEESIRAWAGPGAHVFTLIRPAGNINHVNVQDLNTPVYSEELPRRIGAAYAEIARRALEAAEGVAGTPVTMSTQRLVVPKRVIAPEAVARAKELAAQKIEAGGKDLTAEDLARGNPEIERIFALQLLEYLRQTPEAGRKFDVALLSFGKDLGILFYPGEPFVELSKELAAKSPFKRLMVASLANGECGYVAPAEFYGRGGYEVLPVVGGGPREDTFDRMVALGKELMAKATLA
jgi:hypothetical protein